MATENATTPPGREGRARAGRPGEEHRAPVHRRRLDEHRAEREQRRQRERRRAAARSAPCRPRPRPLRPAAAAARRRARRPAPPRRRPGTGRAAPIAGGGRTGGDARAGEQPDAPRRRAGPRAGVGRRGARARRRARSPRRRRSRTRRRASRRRDERASRAPGTKAAAPSPRRRRRDRVRPARGCRGATQSQPATGSASVAQIETAKMTQPELAAVEREPVLQRGEPRRPRAVDGAEGSEGEGQRRVRDVSRRSLTRDPAPSSLRPASEEKPSGARSAGRGDPARVSTAGRGRLRGARRPRDRLAEADAHAGEAVTRVAPLELRDERRGDPGAGRAERMPERDAAAVRVHVAGLVALLQARVGEELARRPTRTPRSPRSPRCRPSRARPSRAPCSHASGLPCSIRCGSTPAIPNERKRARGSSPSSEAFASEAISTAAEPSTIWDEFPAVTTPSGMNAGCSAAIFSSVVSRRTASSTAKRTRSASRCRRRPRRARARRARPGRSPSRSAPRRSPARRACATRTRCGRAPRARASTSSRSPRPRCPA